MKKIAVGDEEYFLDDSVITYGVMRKINAMPQGEDKYNFVIGKIEEAIGQEIMDSIPYTDLGEVIGKSFSELFLPHSSADVKENAIRGIMKAFHGN